MYKFLSFLSVLFFVSCVGQVEKKLVSKVVDQKEWTQILSETESAQIVDVRTPEEYADGYLEGATNINFYDADFKAKMNETLDKEQPVFIYCMSGGRSGKAASMLMNEGYKEVYDLQSGYSGWKH